MPPLSARRGRRATRRATAGAARSSSGRPSWRRPSPTPAGARRSKRRRRGGRGAAATALPAAAPAPPARRRPRCRSAPARRACRLITSRPPRVEARLVDADEDAQALRQRLLAEGGDGVLHHFSKASIRSFFTRPPTSGTSFDVETPPGGRMKGSARCKRSKSVKRRATVNVPVAPSGVLTSVVMTYCVCGKIEPASRICS